ncbi:ABC-2 type transport system permease protein [Peptostreptococcaceae bacterium pGA-8]|nr:ABC-2 type transport system permease protein [Peptostreptococcaceae bacterium pGA-8]
MKNIIILSKAQLINLFPSNKDSIHKDSLFFRFLGVSALFILLCMYNMVSLKAIIDTGLYKYVMPYAVSLVFFFVMIMSLFKSNSMFFYNKDYEILMPLPVSKYEILISKFGVLYLINMVLTLSVILPAIILLLLKSYISLFVSILFLLAGLFVAIIPMCIASIMGVLIEFIGIRVKKKNFITVLFITILFIVYFIFISDTNRNDIEIKNMVESQLFRVFPLSKLFYLNKNIAANIGIYVIATVIFLILYFGILGKRYEKIYNLLNDRIQESNHSEIIYEINTPFFALYKKELRRFLSSNVYIVNSSFGVIILGFFSISCILFGDSMLEKILSINDVENLFSRYGALIVSSFLVMSCTTSAAMSLEGKNLWILQSSPIDMKKVVTAKIAVNLTTHFIAYMLSIIMIVTRLNSNIIQLTLAIIVPIVYSVFISILGMYLNIKYLNLKWNDEISVIKHSTSAILTNILGIISVALPILCTVLVKLDYEVILAITCFFMIAVSIKIYKSFENHFYIS